MKNLNHIYNCIVRIQSQISEYNWLQPYKSLNDVQSIGTGFFIDKHGHILTCAHVVKDSVKVWVSLPNEGKNIYEVEIVSYYPEMDIALLKIKTSGIHPYIKLGNSDNITPSESVTAVGYPLGQDKLKFTKGIISGRQDDNIQTDTPLNPGNSGGPLINNKYEVIGINSSGIAPDTSENVGYAIPINFFKRIQKQMTSGKNLIIFKPSLGIKYQHIDNEIKKYYSSKNSGVLISHIAKNSSLHNKISKGDILCKIDNMDIDNYGESLVKWNAERIAINNILPRYNIGDSIKLHIWCTKESKTKIINHKLQSNNDIFSIREKYPYFENINYLVFGGMIVMELTLNHIEVFKGAIGSFEKYFKIENREEPKLIISFIFPGSQLSNLNVFSLGDILTKINNENINTISDYKNSLIKSVKNKEPIILETEDGSKAIQSINNIREEELFLSNNFNYPISDIYTKYIN